VTRLLNSEASNGQFYACCGWRRCSEHQQQFAGVQNGALVTMTNPPTDYRSMTVAEILEGLFIQIFEPPLSNLRDDLRSVPEVLRIPILIIDLDTEVTMEGMLGFLENFTGLYFVKTIDALETLSAHKAAGTLRSIERIMRDHGVTVERLRKDFDRAQLFQITNFIELHAEELSPMAEQIEHEARKLDIYDPAEPVFDLLKAYLDGRRDELIASLEACQASGGHLP
jgi:hypothetical protein